MHVLHQHKFVKASSSWWQSSPSSELWPVSYYVALNTEYSVCTCSCGTTPHNDCCSCLAQQNYESNVAMTSSCLDGPAHLQQWAGLTWICREINCTGAWTEIIMSVILGGLRAFPVRRHRRQMSVYPTAYRWLMLCEYEAGSCEI